MIRLKVMTVNNVWFANIGFLMMGLNFKIIFMMVVMISRCCLIVSDIVITTVKAVDYRCIIHDISKFEAIRFLENYILDDRGHIYNIYNVMYIYIYIYIYIYKCISKKSILKLSLQLLFLQFSQSKTKIETKTF